MKVFISWSGDKSHEMAKLLNWWLKCVIQAVDPWLSSKDIDKGALWFSEINTNLSAILVGIVCLTRENKNKPWILFESGALAKGISSSRVCPLLIDLEPTDVEPPLSQFNLTVPNKEGMWNLIKTINAALPNSSLDEVILGKIFDTYWVQFEDGFRLIQSKKSTKKVTESRSQHDMLAEVLSSIRGIDKKIRHIESQNTSVLDNEFMSSYNKSIMQLQLDKINHSVKPLIHKLVADDLPREMIYKIINEKVTDLPQSLIKYIIDKEFLSLN